VGCRDRSRHNEDFLASGKITLAGRNECHDRDIRRNGDRVVPSLIRQVQIAAIVF
jgi:hypothetical protein